MRWYCSFAVWFSWQLIVADLAGAEQPNQVPRPVPSEKSEASVSAEDKRSAVPSTTDDTSQSTVVSTRQIVPTRTLENPSLATGDDLLEFDVNGDGQLSRRELQDLDVDSRRELLRLRDIDFDNQLSRFEMPPTRAEVSASASLVPGRAQAVRESTRVALPDQRAFQNLRRFGMGADLADRQRLLIPQAASFGTSGGVFTRTTRKPFAEYPYRNENWSLMHISSGDLYYISNGLIYDGARR